MTVIAPATHDTASAVAAVPADRHRASASAIVAAGLVLPQLGDLVAAGRRGPAARHHAPRRMRYNFTNEGGVAGTTRLLKNIMGLWLVQESRRTWARAGREWSYEELTARAQVAPPFAALVDPDDTTFLAPGDMPARLAAYCTRTGQAPPARRGGDRPLLPGEPGSEVPLGDRPARGDPGHDDPDDPRGRRRHARTRCSASSPPTPAAARCMPGRSRPRRSAIS